MTNALTPRAPNWPRVLAGGLPAGVIINVSGLTLAHFFLGREYVEALQARMSGPPTASTVALHLGVRFWFGLLGVTIYAFLRAHFGPGPKTAAIAGAIVWFSACLALTIMLNQIGVLVGTKLWITLPWTQAELVLATLAGAAVYRERPSAGGAGPV